MLCHQLQSLPYLVVHHSLVVVFLVRNSGTSICLSCVTFHTQTMTLDMHDFRGRKTRPNLIVKLGLQYRVMHIVDNQT